MYTIDQISNQIRPVVVKYDIEHVDIFGSYANGTNTEISDVDFLVKFNTNVPSIFEVFGLQEELKKALSMNVDVITLPLSNPEKISISRTVRIYG